MTLLALTEVQHTIRTAVDAKRIKIFIIIYIVVVTEGPSQEHRPMCTHKRSREIILLLLDL